VHAEVGLSVGKVAGSCRQLLCKELIRIVFGKRNLQHHTVSRRFALGIKIGSRKKIGRSKGGRGWGKVRESNREKNQNVDRESSPFER
jgi:hypothetical protein